MSTAWALLFDLAVVVFNTRGAELMQALLHVNRVFVNVSTHWALQGSLFNLLEQRHVYVIVFI